MPWFSHQWLAHITYFPIAIALMLLPWQAVNYSSLKGHQQLPYHVLGAAALNTAVGALLTQLGVGIGGIFSLWGFCGLLAGMVIVEVGAGEVGGGQQRLPLWFWLLVLCCGWVWQTPATNWISPHSFLYLVVHLPQGTCKASADHR
jgi:hypothetical protein